MNKDYSQIDQILDEIIMGKSNENKLAEVTNDENREDLLKELSIHQSAAALIQRSEVINQVSLIHNAFFESRNGFTADDFPGSRSIKSRRNYVKLWWSAAAVLIIAPLLAFLFIYYTNTPHRLFASQYQTYRINVERSPQQGNATSITEHYQKAEYDEVIKDYKALKMLSAREKMITAFAYMELKQYDEAVPLFDEVIRNNVLSEERLYQDEAEYYLALSLLRTSQLRLSYQIFDKIFVDEEHTFNNRVDKWFMIRLKWLL